ncbi:MAG: tRNA pseudouridine(55) synthase TruB [bacterium]|nr:tRNA pseudouridine(55) synthase TruB [bacterium]
MILNIQKPKGMTSHDVVDEVRRMTGERRVGHAGTLDPFAAGVLIVGVGREATKKLGEIAKGTDKEYVVTVKLGETSTTGDPEGKLEKTGDPSSLSRKAVEDVLARFLGEIEQVPPAYSALKVKGVPSYRLARRGKEVPLPARKVSIVRITLTEFSPPFLNFEVVCSSGTYIRALARDIGSALNVGAHVTELTRTRVGKFTLKEAIPLSALPSFLEKKKGLPGR